MQAPNLGIKGKDIILMIIILMVMMEMFSKEAVSHSKAPNRKTK